MVGTSTARRRSRAKTQYVVNNNFGGVMIWELGHDHFDAWALRSIFAAASDQEHDARATSRAGVAVAFERRDDLAERAIPLRDERHRHLHRGRLGSTLADLNVIVESGATAVFNATQHLRAEHPRWR